MVLGVSGGLLRNGINYALPQRRGENAPGPRSFSAQVIIDDFLSATPAGALNPSDLSELNSLRNESQPQLFLEGLVSLSQRLRQHGQSETALQLFELSCRVQREFANGAAGEAFAERSRRAAAAIQGQGEILPRWEYLGRELAVQATDPAAIFAMGAAGMAFRATRLAALTRMITGVGRNSWIRGLGARLMANAAGFGVETVTFTAAGRLGNVALDREQIWTLEDIGREYTGGALTLLGLKAVGSLSGLAVQRWGRGKQLSHGLVRGLLPQIGMFFGIYASHRLEAVLGLRPHLDDATEITDTLATLIHFHVAGRLTHAAFGPRWQRSEQEINLQTEVLERESKVHLPWSQLGSNLRSFGDGARDLFLSPMWLMMGAGGIGGGSGGPHRGRGETPSAPDASRAKSREVIPIALDFIPSHPMNDGDILRIVRAIVEQDGENYPSGDGEGLASGKKLHRRYAIGSTELSLNNLTSRFRQIRGLKANDRKSLSDSSILEGWKREIFGIEVERQMLPAVPIVLDFTPGNPLPEAEIHRIVRAIVEQDSEMFPGRDGNELMGGSQKLNRRYQIGGEVLSLKTLMGRVRQTRGLLANDTKSLSHSTILEAWRREIFGVESVLQGKVISLDFVPSNPMSESDIHRIVQAIVQQDSELYPERDGGGLSGSPAKFNCRYLLGGMEMTLATLIGRVRQARGLRAQDTTALPSSAILAEWRQKLFGVEPPVQNQQVLTLTLDPIPSTPLSEADTHRIVRTIVEQDSEMYPGGDGGALGSGEQKFRRRYRIGGEEFSLQTLSGRVRQARGLRTDDKKSLPDAEILESWRENFERRIEGIPITLDFTPTRPFSEADIQRIVHAIVEQDAEAYPTRDGGALSSRTDKFHRHYAIDGERLNLEILAGRVRQLSGFKRKDQNSLPNSVILATWRREIFGIERVAQGMPISLDFTPASPMSEADIRRIVRAIVEQDAEAYPDRNGSALSTNKDPFRRRYLIGGEELSLANLAARVRQDQGIRANDTRDLPDATIVECWKREIFGIEPVRRERQIIPITLDFTSSRPMSEADIRRIVQAIVEQDAEAYPQKDGSGISTAKFQRRYQISGEELSLQTLVGRVRQARGLGAGEQKALPTSAILQDWRREIFGIEPVRRELPTIPIVLDFTPENPMGERDVQTIVRAIVAQDQEMYPNGEGHRISTGAVRFSERRYQLGDKYVTLQSLTSLVRRARGLRPYDLKALPDLAILKEWKRELFGWHGREGVVPINLDFTPSRRMTEIDISRIVQAIVAQDAETYPGGDSGSLSSASQLFRTRRYRIAGEELTLKNLANRIRQMNRAGNPEVHSVIIERWKRELLGWQGREGGIPIRLDFTPGSPMPEAEIGRIVQAIVAQDSELYPDGDGRRLSTAAMRFLRRYRIGEADLTLSILANRVRLARGLRAGDLRSLGNKAILEIWKEQFGWQAEQVGIPIQLDFIPGKPMSESDVSRIVRAIVAQDTEAYPGGNGGLLRSSKSVFGRRYRVNEEELSLNTLSNRVRAARGLRAGDTRSLSHGDILEEWKRLFPVRTQEGVIPITLDIIPGKPMTETEIGHIVQAIVAQDSEMYPGGRGESLSSGQNKFTRRYQVANEELTLQRLAGRVRAVRGLPHTDKHSLPDSEIVNGWKRELFGWRERGGTIPISLDFIPSRPMTETDVNRMVQAIVAQDTEMYPGGDVRAMSSAAEVFVKRRYTLGEETLSLNALAGRIRIARGFSSHDTRSVPLSEILQAWKRGLFGWGGEENAIPINLDFAPSRPMTEADVNRIVQAIVAQDSEIYRNGDGWHLSGTKATFGDRGYRIGKEVLSLQALAGRVRVARGFMSNDRRLLPDASILQAWKRELFVWREREGVTPISLDFSPGHPMTESDVSRIVRSIVAQDSEMYSQVEGRLLSGNKAKFFQRRYRIGGEILNLSTLAGRIRVERGLRSNDRRSLSDTAILAAWNREIFEIQDFSHSSPEELETFIARTGVRKIVDIFSEDPALLIEALHFLKRDEFRNNDVREFVRSYVGLGVQGERSGASTRPEAVDHWNRRRAYILTVLRALEAGEALDLSEESFRSQLALFIRMSRKAFEEDPEALITELETQATALSHPFLARLHAQAAEHFHRAREISLESMRNTPYGYQREGVHFLATHDRAILADEAGLGKSYQAIAAVDHLGLDRVLWVTTASNKETLREEILTHSTVPIDRVRVIISGDPGERREQIHSINGERYLITNYETLVALHRSDPEAYGRLTQNLDAIVVDEAQLTDNPQALRSQVVRQIESPRRWLLTATPYQNRPENIWNLLNWLNPDRYPEFNAFKQMYTQSTEGLILLHSELGELMLRRTQRDTMSLFEDPQTIPFAQQLASGIPRLPGLARLAPETSGSYALSTEQADLIAWITADFRDWAEHFNAHLPNGAEPIALEGINPLVKFQTIHRVIYEPEHFGIQSPNPLFAAIDRTVEGRLARGEKVILWAWNTALIDALVARYAGHGVRRIDGQVVGGARDQARHDFQEDSRVKILVANYQSGGVGLTLTAAHAAVFAQLPLQYPLLYQAEGRHRRLIGAMNLRHAKERVEVEWLMPRFPEGFVEELSDPRLAEILSHGTLVEQTRSRLEGGEVLYNIMMEGYGRQEDLDQHFRAGLIRGMGLDRGEALDYTSHLKGEIRNYARAAQSLLPLWRLLEGRPEGEEGVLRLIELYNHYPRHAERLGRAIAESPQAYTEDLAFLASLFELRNKYVRNQMLEHVPELLARSYAQGHSLSEAVRDLGLETSNPVAFLGRLYAEHSQAAGPVTQIARDLSAQRDTPLRRYLEEHFYLGVLGIMENAEAESLLTNTGRLWEEAASNERIHLLYRLGLLARLRPDRVRELHRNSYAEWRELFQAVEAATRATLAEWAGGLSEQVEAMVRTNPHWRGNADPLLALLTAYQSHGDPLLLEQYREAVEHLLVGDFSEWRQGNERRTGHPIEYLHEAEAFWAAFSEGRTSRIDSIRVEPQQARLGLVSDYFNLRREIFEAGPVAEGPWVADQLARFQKESAGEQDGNRAAYQRQLRLMGPLLGGREVSSEAHQILREYDLPEPGDLRSRAAIQDRVTEIRNLLSWMNLEIGFREFLGPDRHPLPGTETVSRLQNLIRELGARARFYRARKHDGAAEHIETMLNSLASYQSQALEFANISIEDTGDPAILTRMGALHPELLNCFNPNGNPTFNQFVVSALGSRNMRMVLVRESGRIVAAAMVKVKQSEDGVPVLFLENGIYRRGYDFRWEMFQHLSGMAQAMEPRPLLMDQVRGRLREEDPWVWGTGAFTENEYIEPVFGLRRSSHVRHRGRLLAMPEEPANRVASPGPREEVFDSPPLPIREGVRVLGFGTSNRTWDTYVRFLREQGVRALVDVRAHPQSRFYPHFNRGRMESALREEGIEYLWLGQTLGNPKDSEGNRSLEGFRSYMQTPGYREGLRQLREILDRTEGNVALTCAEGRECDCHRRFILEDLKRDIENS